ncbi:MAG: NAD-dependent epimerase/dehydratase family protein, partial [Dolichospermum sp.]
MNKFHDKLALITGVTGFLGRYIARYFSEQGWDVIGIGTSPPENAPLANLTKYHCLRLPDSAYTVFYKIILPQFVFIVQDVLQFPYPSLNLSQTFI